MSLHSKPIRYIVMLVMFAFAYATFAMAEEDERITRGKSDAKSRIEWVGNVLRDKAAEVKRMNNYEPIAAKLKDVTVSLEAIKEYYGRRLALYNEGKADVPEEMWKEERNLYDEFNKQDRRYNYSRDAFYNSPKNIPQYFKDEAEKDDIGMDLTLKLEELIDAYKKSEAFYLKLSETGDVKDMALTEEESELILAREKAYHAMELGIEKSRIEKDFARRENVNDNVRALKETMIEKITEEYNLRDQISEIQAKQRVGNVDRGELWQAYNAACQEAQDEAVRNQQNQ
ncbi:MAG: hypothetical protein JXR97_15135 [Planctomycetes bacterium]|nr:hypothetical protein [Planctomycetota bacterium]